MPTNLEIKKNASINHVAQLAGVSPKTVSRVINNEPNVTAKTREKVEEAIRLLGYSPSVSARALASKKSYCIGLFCTTPRGDYFSELQFGAVSVCQQRGYHLITSLIENYYTLRPDELHQYLRTILHNPKPDGILLPPPFCDDRVILQFLEDLGIICIRISPHPDALSGFFVHINEREAAYKMTQYLIELGHHRIAFVEGNKMHGTAVARSQGFFDALQTAGIEADPALIQPGDFHLVSGVNAGTRLLSLEDRPTAIFACNDEMAAGVTIAAHRRGLTIPDDISIVGFDDTPVAQLTWPALTTVRHPVGEMAAEATKLAIDNIQKLKTVQDIQLSYDLIFRESAGPAPTG